MKQEERGFPRDFNFAQFSDSILLSAATTRFSPGGFIDAIMRFTHSAFHAGVLLRGGITIGSIFHEDSIAFGPALGRAYDIESREAQFPRIVFDPETLDQILESSWTFDQRKPRRSIGDSPMIKTDRDGYSFVNFLTGAHMQMVRANPESFTPAHPSSLMPDLDRARTIIEGGLNAFRSQPRTLAKYEWLAKYFNDCAADYGDLEFVIEPIAIR